MNLIAVFKSFFFRNGADFEFFLHKVCAKLPYLVEFAVTVNDSGNVFLGGIGGDSKIVAPSVYYLRLKRCFFAVGGRGERA